MKLTTKAFALALSTALLSGCALIDKNTAMGEGKDAEEAAMRLDSQQFLEEVSIHGKNPKARILAIGKLNDTSRLRWFVCDDDQPPEVRVAAFNRIVKLGKAEEMLKKESSLAQTVVLGRNSHKSDANVDFPAEWRIKAIQLISHRGFYGSRDDGAFFLLNQSIPIKVREAAIGRIELDAKGCALLINAAADKTNPGCKDYLALARGFFASKACYSGNIGNVLGDRTDGVVVSPDAKQLLFSFLTKEKEMHEALQHILWKAIEDEKEGKKDSDNIKFFKWAVNNTKNSKVIGELVRSPGTFKTKIPRFLTEAVNSIDDDAVLIDILTNDDEIRERPELSMVAFAAASRIKDPQQKKTIGASIRASSAPEAKTRAEAIVDVYSIDPNKAYEIVKRWFSTEHYDGNMKGAAIAGAIRDEKVLWALIGMCRKDPASLSSWFRKKIISGLKGGVFNSQVDKIAGFPKDKLDKFVAAMIDKSQKLSAEGKTCVIGNYYAGMPLLGFIALGKTQEIKAMPLDWEIDSEGKHVVVNKFAFDSKNLYKATGLEKSEVVLRLPRKLSVASFQGGVTKLEIERNESLQQQISEAFGDYSDSYNVSGGKLYYRSENQAKGVVLLFWHESGQLIVETLSE